MKSVTKSVLTSWALSALVAVCLTPGLRGLARHAVTSSHRLIFVQNDAPMAVPGSADAQGPVGSGDEDGNYQPGQAPNNGQEPDDPDSAEQQPPPNMEQPSDSDSGNDTSAQPQSGDNGEQEAPLSSGDEN
jgi:hypothetical protein